MTQPLVSLNLRVDNTDLVAIQVARVETDLLNKQENLLAKRSEVMKAIDKLGKKMEKIAQDLADNYFTPFVKAIKDNHHLFPLSVSVSGQFDGKKVNLRCALKSAGAYSTFDSSKEVEVNGELLALKADRDMQEKILEEVNEDIIKVKRALSQISTIERQQRAKLATDTLRQSQEGQKILESLSEIAGLPKLLA